MSSLCHPGACVSHVPRGGNAARIRFCGLFDRIAYLTWRHPKKVLGAIAAFMVLAGAVGGKVEEHLKAAGFSDPDSESERAVELLRDELGYDPEPGIVARISGPGGGELDVTAPAVRAEVARLADRLSEAQFVSRVVNPLEGVPPRREAARASPFVADDGSSLLITGHLLTDDPEEEGGIAANDAERLLESNSLDVGLSGFAVGFNEVESQARKDLTRAELIAFPILAILLLLVFRSVVAASIPLAIGVASILGTFLVLRVMSELVDTSLFALNLTTALSLGLAVDYGLLMVTRYREELAEHGPGRAAHIGMVDTAGRTVFFSGLTVAAAMVALVLFPQRFLYSIGVAGTAVALLASTIALLGVPALTRLLGNRINALSVRPSTPKPLRSSGWYRLASWVMRRPVIVGAASAALMLTASIPALSASLTGPSSEAVPPSQPSASVLDTVESEYNRLVTEPITVTAVGASRRELTALSRDIGTLPGVTGPQPFERADGLAFARFEPSANALAPAPQDAVRAIRDSVEAESGAELFVSGNSARFVDQKSSLRSNLPLVAGIMIVLTLIGLFMLTGSVVLPLKTLVMNGLTLAAVLGVMVVGFQDGLLSGALNYSGPESVELMTLVLVFAITFGLATDYAVLVLARIKEQHDLGQPNREAVATGIGRTGRVITAAAAMLAVVFLAFATSDIFFMKQAAVGQAVGVALDATIVRALLVPSLMALFGDLNWWAPKPLRRLHARFGWSE